MAVPGPGRLTLADREEITVSVHAEEDGPTLCLAVAIEPSMSARALRCAARRALSARLVVKPTHMIGGYAQLSYGFNYYGPTGNQRDEITVIRRRSQDVEY